MSSASAGKFQDHYEVLGVEHKASSDAVQLAYARLAEKYHPKVGATPDHEKYDAVVLAFEILSDPELRKDFDKLKGIVEIDEVFIGGRLNSFVDCVAGKHITYKQLTAEVTA